MREISPTELSNQLLTNVCVGTVGSFALVRSANNVSCPALLIFSAALSSVHEGMLLHALDRCMPSKIRFIAPILSSGFMGSIAGFVVAHSFDLELSDTVRCVALGVAGSYTLFRAACVAKTGEYPSLPIISLVEEAPRALSALFNRAVPNALSSLVNRVRSFSPVLG